jgi:hypothetical protein
MNRMGLVPWMLIMLVALLPATPAVEAASSRAGRNAAASLRLAPVPRGASMGDANTAVPSPLLGNTVDALWYNPAGLGFATEAPAGQQKQVSMGYQQMVMDIGQGYMGYARPVGQRAGIGVLTTYLDYGTTERTVVSGAGGIRAGTYGGRDWAVGLSYGARASRSMPLAVGATLKVMGSTIDNASATAFAADLGAIYRADSVSLPFTVGFAVKNLGTQMSFLSAEEELPALARLGMEVRPHRMLSVAVDVEKVFREDWNVYTGVEFRPLKGIAMRVGYNGSVDAGAGLTAGAGFTEKNLSLDYAYVNFGEFGHVHRAALTVRF